MPVDINRSQKLLGAIPVRINPRAKYIPGAALVISGAKAATRFLSVNIMIFIEVDANAPHKKREVFRSNIVYTNDARVLTVTDNNKKTRSLESLLSEGYRWEKREILTQKGVFGKTRNIREEIYYTKHLAWIIIDGMHNDRKHTEYLPDSAYMHCNKSFAINPISLFQKFGIHGTRIHNDSDKYVITFGKERDEIPKVRIDSFVLDNVSLRDVYNVICIELGYELEWYANDRTAVFGIRSSTKTPAINDESEAMVTTDEVTFKKVEVTDWLFGYTQPSGIKYSCVKRPDDWYDFREIQSKHGYSSTDWYTFERSAYLNNNIKDTAQYNLIAGGARVNSDGRYWVAVGPGVTGALVNGGRIPLTDMYGENLMGRNIDVCIEHTSTKKRVYLYCVVGDTKEHTGAGILHYNGEEVAVDGYGIYQTGISIINGASEGASSADGSMIEFMGDSVNGALSEYKLIEILVY